MDTSEQYINMCRKATELQEKWKITDGDFFYYDDMINTIGDFVEVNHTIRPMSNWDMYTIKQNNCVWLPRADQLIELSTIHWSDIVDYARLDYNENQLSFEITMLKIVVYMVYRKRWNGEDWI